MKKLLLQFSVALIAIVSFSACSSEPKTITQDVVAEPHGNAVIAAIRQANEAQAAQAHADSIKLALQEEELRKERQQTLYKTEITSVLHQDASVVATGIYYDRVAKMRMFDLSKCPNDFSAAFVDHIHAWERAAEIQRALKRFESDDNIQTVLATAFWQKLFGSDEDAFRDAKVVDAKLKSALGDANENISNTYDKVEHIAATYGATLPH